MIPNKYLSSSAQWIFKSFPIYIHVTQNIWALSPMVCDKIFFLINLRPPKVDFDLNVMIWRSWVEQLDRNFKEFCYSLMLKLNQSWSKDFRGDVILNNYRWIMDSQWSLKLKTNCSFLQKPINMWKSREKFNLDCQRTCTL